MKRTMQTLLLAGLIAGGTLASAAEIPAHGRVSPPPVPSNLEVPDGHRPYLIAHAVGTQNQICLPRASGVGLGWSFIGPQATLFNEPGRTDRHPLPQPQPGGAGGGARHLAALARHQRGLGGGDRELDRPGLRRGRRGALAAAWKRSAPSRARPGAGSSRRRPTSSASNTEGGVAPAGDCPAVGARLFVPYTADYVFYRER